MKAMAVPAVMGPLSLIKKVIKMDSIQQINPSHHHGHPQIQKIYLATWGNKSGQQENKMLLLLLNNNNVNEEEKFFCKW